MCMMDLMFFCRFNFTIVENCRKNSRRYKKLLWDEKILCIHIISYWINNGVSTVVLGTIAIQNKKILEKAYEWYNENKNEFN